MAKTVRIEEISGCEGNCIAINEYRIAGPKPWGGGYVIKKWEARVKDIVKALGADVAEVVRCKDCEYRHDSCFAGNDNTYCDFHHKYFPLDGFCSYGERKDK